MYKQICRCVQDFSLYTVEFEFVISNSLSFFLCLSCFWMTGESGGVIRWSKWMMMILCVCLRQSENTVGIEIPLACSSGTAFLSFSLFLQHLMEPRAVNTQLLTRVHPPNSFRHIWSLRFKWNGCLERVRGHWSSLRRRSKAGEGKNGGNRRIRMP